jgi:hypothetical protein
VDSEQKKEASAKSGRSNKVPGTKKKAKKIGKALLDPDSRCVFPLAVLSYCGGTVQVPLNFRVQPNLHSRLNPPLSTINRLVSTVTVSSQSDLQREPEKISCRQSSILGGFGLPGSGVLEWQPSQSYCTLSHLISVR